MKNKPNIQTRFFRISATLLTLVFFFIGSCFANEEANKALVQSIRNCDIKGVKEAIKAGADTKVISDAMRYASSACNIELVKLLLESGAVVNAKEERDFMPSYGTTGLLHASLQGRYDVAKLLIEHGADVNLAGNYGQTPLIYASEYRQPDIVKLLLENGADVNARDGKGETAFTLALDAYLMDYDKKYFDIITLLLNSGADVTVKNESYRETALTKALYKKDTELAQLLLKHGADVDEYSPLAGAAYRGEINIIKFLLANGANVNGDKYNSALWYALKSEHYDVANLLIKYGSDVNLLDGQGRSVLWKVVLNKGGLDVIKLLIENGADVNAGNGSVLMAAARKGKFEIAKLLIEYGADVNKVDSEGRSALIVATEEYEPKIVELLIKHGADLNIKDNKGRSAITIAVNDDSPKIIELLEQHNAESFEKAFFADPNKALLTSVRKNNLENVKKALAYGADINARGQEGETAIWEALAKKNIQIFEYLVENGADINLKVEGVTPIFVAILYGGPEDVEYLIKKGADVNIRGEGGNTALIWAASRGDNKIVKLLIDNGADINAKDNKGQTALSLAKYKKTREILTQAGAK